MKYSILIPALLTAMALSACDRPAVVTPATVVNVPSPGLAGPAGVPGTPGLTGAKGESGLTGSIGATGATGNTGETGERGKTGDATVVIVPASPPAR